jgi:hypothetical protein
MVDVNIDVLAEDSIDEVLDLFYIGASSRFYVDDELLGSRFSNDSSLGDPFFAYQSVLMRFYGLLLTFICHLNGSVKILMFAAMKKRGKGGRGSLFRQYK